MDSGFWICRASHPAGGQATKALYMLGRARQRKSSDMLTRRGRQSQSGVDHTHEFTMTSR